jgi:hypothetical protein
MMEMQQIIEMLVKAEEDRKADKEDMLAKMKEEIKSSHNEMARMNAYHKKRMAMFDAYEKSIMACRRQVEANTEKIDAVRGGSSRYP